GDLLRSVARDITGHRDGYAGRQIIAPPAVAQQGVRAAELDRPLLNLAALVLDVDAEPRMRVGPLHLRDRAGKREHLVDVESRGQRMVGERGRGARQHQSRCERDRRGSWKLDLGSCHRLVSHARRSSFASAAVIPGYTLKPLLRNKIIWLSLAS